MPIFSRRFPNSTQVTNLHLSSQMNHHQTQLQEPKKKNNNNTVHLFIIACPNTIRSARSASIISNSSPKIKPHPKRVSHAYGPNLLTSFTPERRQQRTRLHIHLLQQTYTLSPSARTITASAECSSHFALARHLSRMNLPTTENVFAINAT